MTADMTTIEVPTALRDKLNALVHESGRGTTVADVLRQLLDEHHNIRTRQTLAFDALLERAQADPDAAAKADRTVQRAVAHLQRRSGSSTA
jgi:Arc/MetJ-type ribon-helix-helix transcriptional regulator